MVGRTMESGIDRGSRRQEGFTLIELMIVTAIIALLSAIAVPIFGGALTRAKRTGLAGDGKTLYAAFMKYNIDNGLFPSTSTPVIRVLNLTTLAPLSTSGYVGSGTAITGKLLDGKITAYDSPNTTGPDSDFYAVLTLAKDPNIVVLVASTNQYPGHIGTWYDGVYSIQGASIVKLGS